ncbi:uncharacterized protein DUF5018 [Breznakibacter xylanolyticus]|uniref:Uncharacterized protein DUF5018 n=1 Tax=Breznakibacter xylanolyticus TaxID=990 RepID=A0A2W7NK32_9BACT|nr:DUF5018 domain-containing protein [Breznakibacter xylanolyticus]PZX13546.1 uncharacterized protein DUF5018 [Breznakibacter xylanolyticus]
MKTLLCSSLIKRLLTTCLLVAMLPVHSAHAEGYGAAVSTDGRMDVTFYYLDLNINIESPYISGTVYVEFTPTQNNVNQVFLNLQSALHNSLSVSGDAQSVSKSDNTIVIKLIRAFNMGEKVQFSVAYQGVPQEANNTKGLVYRSITSTQKVIASLSTPWLAHYWWPCKDGTDDKPDSVYVDVTINNKTVDGFPYVAISNGVLEEKLVYDDYTTFKWRHRYPIVTYYVMVAISNYRTIVDNYSRNGHDFPLYYYVFPDHYRTAQYGVTDFKNAFDLFIELYGDYPFKDEKYSMTQLGFYSAIENQTNTIINSFDGDWYYTMVHELAHQWFGCMITCSNWHHGWMNEGFAEYSEALYAERYEGVWAYKNKMSSYEYWGGGSVFLDDISDPFNIFVNIIYSKGAWVLHMLRGHLGDDDFFRCIKAYANDPRWKYRNASTKDLRDLCESMTGKNLFNFFEQWVYDEYYPRYRYNYYSDPANNQAGITIEQRQHDMNGWREVFEMPIQLTFNFTDGSSVDETVYNNAQSQTFYFNFNKTIKSVSFDPDEWILCENQRDTYMTVPRPSGSDAKEIVAFSIDGQLGASVINSANASVSLAMPQGTNLNGLVPSIRVSDDASITPASGVAQNFNDPVSLIVKAQNLTTKTWTVNVSIGQNTENDITSFVIPNQVGASVIDRDMHTVSLTMPYGSSLMALTPSMTVSSGAVISPASGVSRDFSIPCSYLVTAQNGDSQSWSVSVVVAPNSANDIVSFFIEGQVGNAVIDASDHRVAVIMPYGSDRSLLTPFISVSDHAIITPESGTPRNFSSPVSYLVTSQSGDSQSWLVTVANALNDANDILSFIIPGQEGVSVIDPSLHTVKVVMPYGVGLDPLSPVISVSEDASISPESGVARNFSRVRDYTVTAQNGNQQLWKVTVTNAPNPANDILSFAIAGQEGESLINASNHSVSVVMPYGTSRTNLVPVITVSPGATINPASGLARDFTNTVGYVVSSQSGVPQSWSISVSNAPNPANDILSFAIPGQVGTSVINASTHSVSVVMPYGTSRNSLTPVIGISPGATINPISGMARDFSDEVDYLVTSQSGVPQSWSISVSNGPNPANDILSFAIAGQEGVSLINTSNHSVSVVMPYGVNRNNLVPVITVSPGATINPASGMALDFSDEVDYLVTSQSGVPQSWSVSVSNAPNAANDILSFAIAGQVGESVINATSHSVSLVMPYGVSRTNLVPVITVSDGATINPASGIARDFSDEVGYVVTSQSGVPQSWSISVSNAPNPANDILSFAIAGQVGESVINASDHSVSVVMSYGVNRNNLVPVITVSPGATINPASGMARDFSDEVDYLVTSQSGVPQSWSVSVSNAPNAANDILSFAIAGQVGVSVINASNHSVSVVMPYGTSRTNLTPVITVSDGATINPASGMARDFTNTVEYVVTSQSSVPQSWSISVSNAPNPANDILSFAIAGQEGVSLINASNHSVSVVMPYGTSRTNLVPVITVSDGATINPASGVTRDFTNTVEYVVTSQSGVPQSWSISVSNAPNPANDILSFAIAGQEGVSLINASNHSVSVVMPYGTSRTNLVPVITVSDGATINPASGVTRDFTNTVEYVVTSQSGVPQSWSISVSNAPNPANDILSFAIAGQEGVSLINASKHSVSVVMPYGISRNSLAPVIGISPGATINPASGVARDFSDEVDYLVTSQSGVSQSWSISVTNAPNPANDILSFAIAGQVGESVINASTHSVSVVMPYGTSRNSLTPVIGISPGATINPISGMARDFTNTVDYVVSSQSGVPQSWSISVSNAPNPANDILSFAIPGQVGVSLINTSNHSVSVVMPYGVSRNNLVPVITVSDGATINPASGMARDFTNTVGYVVISQSSVPQSWSISVSNAPNPANDILSFAIPGQVGVRLINTSNHSVSVVMPYGTSRNNLVPVITVSDGATINPASGMARDFTSRVNYSVMSQTGVSQSWAVTVVNAPNTANDIIAFHIEGQVGESMIHSSEHSVSLLMPYGTNLSALAPLIRVSEGAVVSPQSGMMQNFSGTVYYLVTAASGTKLSWKVNVGLAPNTMNDITAVEIPYIRTVVDIQPVLQRVVITIPHGVSRLALAPVFTVSEMASIVPASGVLQDFTNDVIYTVTSQSGLRKLWTVTVRNADSDDNDISAFSIPGQVGMTSIDRDAHTVSVVMPYATSLASLSPAVVVSDDASLDPASGVSMDFSSSVTYTVTSQSGLSQTWRVNVSHALNTANQMVGFVIDGQVGETVINAASHTVTVTMPYGSDCSALVPRISVSEAASVLPESGVQQDFNRPVIYSITSQSGESLLWRVNVIISPNTHNDILSFAIPGLSEECRIDPLLRTVWLSVPYGTDRGSLTPDIVVSPEASVVPESGITVSLSKPRTYVVTSQSGSSAEWTVTVTEEPNSDNDILNFYIASQVGESTIDTDAHTINIIMPHWCDVSRLTPVVIVSDNADIDPKSGLTTDFSLPVVYAVTAEDGSTLKWIVTVNRLIDTASESMPVGQILVYPNPTNGPVEIQSTSVDLFAIRIYTIDGSLVHAQSFTPKRSHTFSFSYDQRGIFFLHIDTSAGSTIHQIVVAH